MMKSIRAHSCHGSASCRYGYHRSLGLCSSTCFLYSSQAVPTTTRLMRTMITLLVSYASTLTLSLYLFNLLPLPLLDGSQLADALAELGYTWLSSRHTATRRVVIDMEMGAVQPSMYLRTWKTQYERGKWATQLALGLMVAVGIVAALWRQALQ